MKIGVVGIGISKEIAKKIATRGLRYYPLGSLFELDIVDACFPNKDIRDAERLAKIYEYADYLRIKRGLDLSVVLGKNIGNKVTSGLISCYPHSMALAHQIGHYLGLKHPHKDCRKKGCIPNCRNLDNLMCMLHEGARLSEFSDYSHFSNDDLRLLGFGEKSNKNNNSKFGATSIYDVLEDTGNTGNLRNLRNKGNSGNTRNSGKVV